MEMEHARMLKHSLQESITKLTRDFEIQTGLVITGFSINKNCAMGRKPEIRSVEITTEFR